VLPLSNLLLEPNRILLCQPFVLMEGSKKRKRNGDDSSSQAKQGASELPSHQNKRRKLLATMLTDTTATEAMKFTAPPQRSLGKFSASSASPKPQASPKQNKKPVQDVRSNTYNCFNETRLTHFKPKPQDPSPGVKHTSSPKASPHAKPQQQNHSKTTSHIPSSSKASSARTKLDGARFRFLNEQLYTTDGNASYERFQAQPELFDVVCQVTFCLISPQANGAHFAVP